MGDSNTLDDIMFERGWGRQKLERELFKRRIILSYLIKNEISDYVRVAATIQAFINDPDTILALIAKGQLLESLEDLREMESVDIQVDPEKEALVPRPEPDDERLQEANQILDKAEDQLFEDYRQMRLTGLGVDDALDGMSTAPDTIEATPASADEFEFGGSVDDEFEVTDEDLEDLTTGEYDDEELSGGSAAWVDDDSIGFEDDSGGAIWSDDSGGGETETGSADSASEAAGTESSPSTDSSTEPVAETETETETQSGTATESGEEDTEIFAGEDEAEGAPAEGGDDEMESIFGGDEADEDVSLFDDEDGDSIFGDSDQDDEEDDDGEDTIFGGGGA